MFSYKSLVLAAFCISTCLGAANLVARGGEFRGGGDFREGGTFQGNFHEEGSPSLHQQEYRANHPYHPNEGQNFTRHRDEQEFFNSRNNWDNAYYGEESYAPDTSVEVETSSSSSTEETDSANSQGYNFLNDYND